MLTACATTPSPADRLAEVAELVDTYALNPQMTLRFDGPPPQTHAEATAQIRAALAALDVSHTSYWTPLDPEYHDITGIFGLDEGRAVATTTTQGMLGQAEGDGWRVRNVLDGSPAAHAGMQRGDLIVAVDGQRLEPVASFRGDAGRTVTLTFERAGQAMETSWPIAPRTHADTWLAATRASARVIDVDNARIGYVHFWSFTGTAYVDLLVELLRSGELAQADALIVDLRDGWGGAPIEATVLFGGRLPDVDFIQRNGSPLVMLTPLRDPIWTRPVALLTDERTRSGKELLAHAFVTQGLGPVVGERTAGAVVGGSPFVLADDALLFLAVLDARIDGVRLEGVGVAPTVPVTRNSGPDDPALAKALTTLANIVHP